MESSFTALFIISLRVRYAGHMAIGYSAKVQQVRGLHIREMYVRRLFDGCPCLALIPCLAV
jgi:hypothetical protein